MISIKNIWDSHKHSDDIITKIRIDEISYLNCYAAINNITYQYIFILSLSEILEFPILQNYRFKGVEIYVLEDSATDTKDLYIYLIDNDLKDIFSLFIQNILDDIQTIKHEKDALDNTLNIISRWKRLFDKMNFSSLSIEKQKGLIGELLFLNYLLDNQKTKTNAILFWTSTENDFQSKDFIIGSIGFEIKFTSSKQPHVRISNERQLDIEGFNKLFLILYSTEAVKDNGISLNSLIDQTREKIHNDEMRVLFNSKLYDYGYTENDKDFYNKMFLLKRMFCFSVNNDFPKITKLNTPLGIYETSYSIEISSIEKFIIENDKIL
jgi:hypothetical protein